MSEPVRKIESPVRIEYRVEAGRAQTRYLSALAEGRILGHKCDGCAKVYVPARSSCPTCGIAMTAEVAVAETGTVTTFCIVNVPFEGQTMKLPYVYASVLLDGSDIPILHLIEVPAAEARMGLRVKAEWEPPGARPLTMMAIKWFVPTGEPDAPFDAFKEHL